jgi:hypothetical protein
LAGLIGLGRRCEGDVVEDKDCEKQQIWKVRMGKRVKVRVKMTILAVPLVPIDIVMERDESEHRSTVKFYVYLSTGSI